MIWTKMLDHLSFHLQLESKTLEMFQISCFGFGVVMEALVSISVDDIRVCDYSVIDPLSSQNGWRGYGHSAWMDD